MDDEQNVYYISLDLNQSVLNGRFRIQLIMDLAVVAGGFVNPKMVDRIRK